MTGKEMTADTVVTLKARSQPSISAGSPLPVRPTCTSTTLPEHTPRTAPAGPRDGFRPTDFQQQGHSHFWARQLVPAHQLSSAPAGATRSHQVTRRGTAGRRQGSPRQWTGWKRARSITYTRRFQTFICRCSKTYPVLTQRPRASPGENTGAGCCALVPGVFPTQRPWSPALQADPFLSEPPGKPEHSQTTNQIFTTQTFSDM